MQKIIGILGGIGPESTGQFYLNLIDKFQKRFKPKDNTQYPHIIINSIPAPELVFDKISDEDIEPYIKGIRDLEKFGVDFIVMACNTIHLFHKKLQSNIKIPIMDLRKEVEDYLIGKKVKSITVLGTPMTMKQGLYKFSNFKYFDLDDEDVKNISNSIFKFNKGIERKEQAENIEKIARKYHAKGADVIISGCTEISLMLEGTNIPEINTMEIFSDAIIKKL